MKKIIGVLLCLLIGCSAYAEAPASDSVFSTGDISFSLVDTYFYQSPVCSFIILEFNWKNLTDEPLSFMLNLSITGYQNGKELSNTDYEPDYVTDTLAVNTMTRILPGHENTDYEFIPIKDDSEVMIVIDKAFDVGDGFEDITYTVEPNELPIFEWDE